MIANLEYYKVFYYAAKYGRITDAAKELNISQPAVSQSLKQLEQQLGVQLFVRTSKGVRLTQEGTTLFEYVRGGIEMLEKGERSLRQMMNLENGEIRIGASDMTLRFFLLPFLEIFHERYPGIKVFVTNAPTPETVDLLEKGQIDFGVVSTPFSENDAMDVIPVKQIADTFICGRRFMHLKNKTLDLKELEKLPLISLEKKTSSRSYMEQFLAGHNVVLKPEFELATSDMIVQFSLRNMGVGIVMREFAEEAIRSGKLFELRFNKVIPGREFCLIIDKRNPLSAAAQTLIQIIREAGQRDPGLPETGFYF